MKLTKTLAFLLPFTLFSCADEDAATILNAQSTDITISANVSQMSGNKSLKIGTSFDSGDAISVYAWTGSADEVGELQVNNSINTLQEDGTWSASPTMKWKDSESEHYFLGVYPQREITNFTSDEYTLNLSDQEASDILVATNVSGLVATKNAVPLSFTHVMARLRINLNFINFTTAPTTATVTLSAPKTATINYLTKAITEGTTKSSITLPSIESTTANTLSFQSIMVPSAGFNEVTIVTANTTYKFNSASLIKLTSAHSTTINLNVTYDQPEVSMSNINIIEWEEDYPIEGDTDKQFKMKSVDLGLPSGNLWAKCNLGATQHWEFGDLYMWGETEPFTQTGWIYYKFATPNSRWGEAPTTKYTHCANPTETNYSYVDDGLDTLEPEDDAAYQTLGEGWHIPDATDFEELINECTIIWTADYNNTGEKGIIVYESKCTDDKGLFTNGECYQGCYCHPILTETYSLYDNHIFLPEAGSDYLGGGRGMFGEYWSRNNTDDNMYDATNCFFSDFGISMSASSKYMALAIRPIKSKD